MKRTSSQVEAEELVEFKTQFGEFADAARTVWKCDEFDQGRIRDQLNRFFGWDESQSYAATWEFLRFFVLKAQHQDFDDEILAPSPIVERVWQCVLMRPKFYYTMCHTLVADLIDYKVDRSRDRARYEKTLELYEEQYQRKPDEKCWTPVESYEEAEEDEGSETFQTKFGDASHLGQFVEALQTIWKCEELEKGKLATQLNRLYGSGWDKEMSDVAIWEFMRFFVLKADHQYLDDEILAPSPTVERVWQCILMRPKFYYQMSQALVADLMDYNVDQVRDRARYAKTLHLYEEKFQRKPDETCWIPAESFGDEEEKADETQNTAPEVSEEDVQKAMYDMIQNNVRLSPFEVKQRWGHVLSEEKLRKMWVNLIARGSLRDRSVKPAKDQQIEKKAKKAGQKRRLIQSQRMKNFVDDKFNDYGEGERYYIRCKHISGRQLTVRAPKNSLVGRVKKLICFILPNRKPSELVLTQLDESEQLDDNKTLLEYGIFKNSTFILSFDNSPS